MLTPGSLEPTKGKRGNFSELLISLANNRQQYTKLLAAQLVWSNLFQNSHPEQSERVGEITIIEERNRVLIDDLDYELRGEIGGR